MENLPENPFAELVNILKSWIPRRPEPENVSRVFWMPDNSCRVCYDCDSQFTIFNRRHHCRLCGRIFCGKCTANSVPLLCYFNNSSREEGERLRVCNYCFKHWEQGTTNEDSCTRGMCLSPSLSTTSLISTKSTATNSIISITGSFAAGAYQHVLYSAISISEQSSQVDPFLDKQDTNAPTQSVDSIPNFHYDTSRNYEDDDEYGVGHDPEAQCYQNSDDYYAPDEFDEVDQDHLSTELHLADERVDSKETYSEALENIELHPSLVSDKIDEEADNSYECDASSSLYHIENSDSEPLDFESNGLIWLPPEPEDEEDEIEVIVEDEDVDTTGEFDIDHSSSSFGSGEYRSRERPNEEHKKAMKNVVDGHFRALIAQLLQVENVQVGEEGDQESWLEIVTSLSWEAATLLKPDTSKGGGMDPGGYVKVKCLACGQRSESKVVKGVVCRKNVAHRRMASKIEKPRFLILGGALEYQRVTNLLSSFDTLLQQEMDHLKMAVAKIAAHKPNVLLVEKSVSRFAQEYLLAKGISLVLNIKRPVLERISRCTGAQIIPSIDHLSPPMLGRCDFFLVEKFAENHISAEHTGKKTKTLMFFEGCPKPLGCTVLLKGANIDELKKIKHVVQYGVFAAYHLAVETSFLADEGASLPELPLRTPITVGIPDKSSTLDRSISVFPDFLVPAVDNSIFTSSAQRISDLNPFFSSMGTGESVTVASLLAENHNRDIAHGLSIDDKKTCSKGLHKESRDHADLVLGASNRASLPLSAHGTFPSSLALSRTMKEKNKVFFGVIDQTVSAKHDNSVFHDSLISFTSHDSLDRLENEGCGVGVDEVKNNELVEEQVPVCIQETSFQNVDHVQGQIQVKEEFPPTSDNQSILVSVSIRCVWKGTVCERSQLFRIKYYGNFDKPLGRFLRDHLFDQNFKCRSCDSPTEAHVHCYTHRQGSITITVTNIPEPLPGEKDGKIWMWHRCLKCPRNNGLPPATRRIVMSDAAWGLSFGKFLELSFSNHAAANRVASCGHSLHRDCLRFYGYGKMVACFRYTAIIVYSVYLPPSIVDFDCQHQDWIQKEAKEVDERAKLFFGELQSFICQFLEKTQNNGVEMSELQDHLLELEQLLQKEKIEFEDSLHKVIHGEEKKGQPVIDLLEVNKLRRKIVFLLSLWYHRLALLAESDIRFKEMQNTYLTKDKLYTTDKIKDSNILTKQQKDSLSSNTTPDPKTDETLKGDGNDANHPKGLNGHHTHIQQQSDAETDIFSEKQSKTNLYTSASATEQSISLESGLVGRRTLSDGQVPLLANLSETFDAKWTGDNATALPDFSMLDPLVSLDTSSSLPFSSDLEQRTAADSTQSFASMFSKLGDSAEDITSRYGIPFPNIYRSTNRNWGSTSRFDDSIDCNSVFSFLLQELEHQNVARFFGVNDIVIPIYDDEPTSVISFALISHEYHNQLSEEREKVRDGVDSSQLPFLEAGILSMTYSSDEIFSDHLRSFGSTEESLLSMSGSRSSVGVDQGCTKAMHARISFTDEGPLGKVKYTVMCYYAKPFDDLRRACCPNEVDFLRSLSRCKKWGAQGGKSNVFFAKTLDDRFIVKQVTKTELESFIKFAPQYFKYLSESIATGSPTCLAKILGIYQVASKNLKGGKESRMDVLVMENLVFCRNLTRLYDLKGSSRSRYNADSSGNNKVLLDQNLIEAMPTSPIFVGNKAKRLLERAVWNDTAFLASIDVMDYSLLAGVDEEKHELVVGIIDFMRQYTWDKHLETWVKASGILGGPKNVSPTVISPKQYKKRFRKAMSAYFLVVPDQWSPPAIIPNSKLPAEENQQDTSLKE